MNVSLFSEFIISWWTLAILKCLLCDVWYKVKSGVLSVQNFVTLYCSARTVIQCLNLKKI